MSQFWLGDIRDLMCRENQSPKSKLVCFLLPHFLSITISLFLPLSIRIRLFMCVY